MRIHDFSASFLHGASDGFLWLWFPRGHGLGFLLRARGVALLDCMIERASDMGVLYGWNDLAFMATESAFPPWSCVQSGLLEFVIVIYSLHSRFFLVLLYFPLVFVLPFGVREL